MERIRSLIHCLVGGVGDHRLPVVLDEVLKIFTVCGSRVGNVVIREPSLKLGLMPLVVSYEGSVRVFSRIVHLRLTSFGEPIAGNCYLGGSKCKHQGFGEGKSHLAGVRSFEVCCDGSQ